MVIRVVPFIRLHLFVLVALPSSMSCRTHEAPFSSHSKTAIVTTDHGQVQVMLYATGDRSPLLPGPLVIFAFPKQDSDTWPIIRYAPSEAAPFSVTYGTVKIPVSAGAVVLAQGSCDKPSMQVVTGTWDCRLLEDSSALRSFVREVVAYHFGEAQDRNGDAARE